MIQFNETEVLKFLLQVNTLPIGECLTLGPVRLRKLDNYLFKIEDVQTDYVLGNNFLEDLKSLVDLN